VNNRLVVSIALFALTILPQASFGQGPIDELKGAAIPEYHTVEFLFAQLSAGLGPPETDDEYWLSLLKIAPGTAAETVLRSAVSNWRELTFGGPKSGRWETVHPDGSIEIEEVAHYLESGETFVPPTPQETREKELRRARQLAQIYISLRRDLQTAGVDEKDIDHHIKTEVVPNMVVLTDGAPDTVAEAFETERRKIEKTEEDDR